MSCLDCKNRHVGCHSDCDDYIAQREKVDKKKAAMEEKKLFDRYNREAKHSKYWYKKQNAK